MDVVTDTPEVVDAPSAMSDDVRALVHKNSIAAATIGVVLSPIPLLDEIVLVPLIARMTRRIAKLHAVAKVPWGPVLKSTAVGLVARGLVVIPFIPVPGVSTAVDAASAAALTEILGEYVDTVCRDPGTAHVLKVREVADMIQRAVRKKVPKAAAKNGAPAATTA
jgi:uncharacterized protein (DUF697 family)